MLDLKKLEQKLDKVLEKETKESLDLWLNTKRKNMEIEKHIDNIRELGYTVLPKVFSNYQVDYLLILVKKYYEETKDKQSKDVPYLNQSQPNVYNLQSKDINFIHALLDNEKLEEILKCFLNDRWYKQIDQSNPNYILRSYGARSSQGALPLHIDSFIPYQGDDCLVMQVVICLEDMTLENGTTLAIPGSHKSGKYANKEDNNKTVPLLLKKGDLAIWDSRIHHSTTENTSGGTRWAIVASFCRYWLKQQFRITEDMPEDILVHLSKKQKSILGFASIPPLNEYEGIEMKKGYDQI